MIRSLTLGTGTPIKSGRVELILWDNNIFIIFYIFSHLLLQMEPEIDLTAVAMKLR